MRALQRLMDEYPSGGAGATAGRRAPPSPGGPRGSSPASAAARSTGRPAPPAPELSSVPAPAPTPAAGSPRAARPSRLGRAASCPEIDALVAAQLLQAQPSPAPCAAAELPPHLVAAAEQLRAALAAPLGAAPAGPGAPRAALLAGPAGAGKVALAAGLARQAGAALLALPAEQLLHRHAARGPAVLASAFALARRQPGGAVLLLRGLEALVPELAAAGTPGTPCPPTAARAAALCAELAAQLRALDGGAAAGGEPAPPVVVLATTAAAAVLPDGLRRLFGATLHVPAPCALACMGRLPAASNQGSGGPVLGVPPVPSGSKG
jgi:hypothetical protein